MDDLISILNDRLDGRSIRGFAIDHGLNAETLRLWLTGQRQINIDGMRQLAAAFRSDRKVQSALRSYWIGLLEEAVKTAQGKSN